MRVKGPIVFQYPLSSGTWSPFQWGYIHVDDNNLVQSIQTLQSERSHSIPNSNQCSPLIPQPETLRVFDPSVTVGKMYYLGIYESQLYKFLFAKSDTMGTRLLPTQQYNAHSDSWPPVPAADKSKHLSGRDNRFQINAQSGDDLYNSIAALESTYTNQYLEWEAEQLNIATNAMTTDESSWLQERKDLSIENFVNQIDPTGKLNTRQIGMVLSSGFFADWSMLKNEATSKEVYCLALMAILTGNVHWDLDKSIQTNAVSLRWYFSASQINKLVTYDRNQQVVRDFYLNDTRASNEQPCIGDVHRYISYLLFTDLSKYLYDVEPITERQFSAPSIKNLSLAEASSRVGQLTLNDVKQGLNEDAIAVFNLISLYDSISAVRNLDLNAYSHLFIIIRKILDNEPAYWQTLSDLETIYSAWGGALRLAR